MKIETVIIIQLVFIGIMVVVGIFLKIKEKRERSQYRQMRWDNSIMGKMEREMKANGEWDD